MPDYRFDNAAIITFSVTAPDYATARRAAEAADEFDQLNNEIDGLDDPGVFYFLENAAPRGRPYLVQADDTDEDITEDEPIPQPLTGDARESLKAALDEADEALGGDSNDAEHDALYSVRETIAGLLGINTEAPEPDYSYEHYSEYTGE